MCMRVRACVRVCVRACVRVCVCVKNAIVLHIMMRFSLGMINIKPRTDVLFSFDYVLNTPQLFI